MFNNTIFVIFSFIVISVTLDVSLALIFRDKIFTNSIVASSKSEINTESHGNRNGNGNGNDELVSLVKRIDTEQLPLFDFSMCMEELLNTEAYSFLQLENVYNKYLDALRDFYFHRFLRELGDISSSSVLNEELFNSTKQRILKECKVAMTTATPLHVRNRWDIEGPLEELDLDIKSKIEKALKLLQPAENEESSTAVKQNVWKKRIKWIAMQSILFLLNFLQNEWHRKVSKRAANRRLAEVPEFPML